MNFSRSDILAVGALSAPILVNAYVGTFSRYVADDYCIAASVSRSGLLESQWSWYMTWTGRYAYTLAASLPTLIGTRIVPVLPAVSLLAWFTGLAWLCHSLRLPVVMALLVMDGTLLGTPTIAQSLYWETGAANFFLPLILAPMGFAAVLSVIRRNQPPWQGALLAFSFAFIVGGFSETFPPILAAGLAMLILLARRRGLAAVWAFAGALCATAIVIAAPGNAFRAAHFPTPPEPPLLVLGAIVLGTDFAIRFAATNPALPLTLAGGILLGRQLPGRQVFSPKTLMVTLATAWGLVIASFAPSLWGTSAPPAGRVLIVPTFILVCLAVAVGYALNDRLRQFERASRAIHGLAVAVVLLVVAVQSFATLERVPQWAAFAYAWDAQNEAIQSGRPAQLLENPYGLEYASGEPDNWVNQCVASYYGLPSFTAAPAEAAVGTTDR